MRYVVSYPRLSRITRRKGTGPYLRFKLFEAEADFRDALLVSARREDAEALARTAAGRFARAVERPAGLAAGRAGRARDTAVRAGAAAFDAAGLATGAGARGSLGRTRPSAGCAAR